MKKNKQNAREIKTTKNTWHFKNQFVNFFLLYTHIYQLKLYIFFYRTYFMFLMLYLAVHSFDFTNINFLTWQCKVAPSSNQFTANLFLQYVFIYFSTSTIVIKMFYYLFICTRYTIFTLIIYLITISLYK